MGEENGSGIVIKIGLDEPIAGRMLSYGTHVEPPEIMPATLYDMIAEAAARQIVEGNDSELRRRFHPVNGHGGLGINLTDPVESLTPRGWIMFDPWTFCTYCDICWDVDAGFLREDAEAVNFDA